MASKFRQDMPPPGGYGSLEWAKKIPKKGLSGYAIFGIAFGVMGVSWAGYYYEQHLKRLKHLEETDARLAIYPLLLAEEHRAYLTQLRKNRDYENELMKNHPGWVTGTLYGEKLYDDVNGKWPVVAFEAYYAHTRHSDMYDRMFERRKH